MICAFHPVYTLLGAPETSYHYNRCARYGRAAVPARRGLSGEDYPVSCVFTRASWVFTLCFVRAYLALTAPAADGMTLG